MVVPSWLNQTSGKLGPGCEMTTDQAECSIEQMCAEIARLQVMNQCEADLAWALAHMFDVPEGPVWQRRMRARPNERGYQVPSSYRRLRSTRDQSRAAAVLHGSAGARIRSRPA